LLSSLLGRAAGLLGFWLIVPASTLRFPISARTSRSYQRLSPLNGC
jgi:hypothetical protein